MHLFKQTNRRRGIRGSFAMLAALAIGAASCSDQTTSPSGRPVPGSARFTQLPPPAQALSWLAPLGTATANPATFDPAVAPRIEICAWVSNACSGSSIATFTTVTVNSAAGRYEATWSLMSTTFTTRKTYRIRVFTGVTETGAISVDVVRGRWALTRTDGTLAPLVSATELPIRFHIARLTCANTSSCAEQVVPPTIPAGTSVTVKTNDGNHWVTFQGDATGKWNTQGIPAVVTIEDVTTQLGGTVAGCEQGLTKMVVQGHCVHITTVPAVTLAAPAVVCMTLESYQHDWQLVKYDPGSPPLVKFLRDPPALACPQTGGRDGGGDGGANPIRRVASAIGHALLGFITPKNAYAFDLGVGGTMDAGDAFSYFAPGLPAQLQVVSSANVSGVAGAALTAPQVVRIMNTHHNTPIGGAVVTCSVTAGAGSLASSQFPGRAVENPTGTYTCPTWTLGATAGVNTVDVTANIIDDFVVGGTVRFTATGTPACTASCAGPALVFTHTEQYSVGDALFDRYDLAVTNASSFPASLFDARPGATECISKTRVEIYDASTDQVLEAFCGLGSLNDLAAIWFAVNRWVQPPAGVYVKFIDAATGALVYKSNTVSVFGPEFSDFPPIEQFNWASVPDAVSYLFETQRCTDWNTPDWRVCNDDWTSLQSTLVQSLGITGGVIIERPASLRWRVTAVNANGASISTSDWKYYRYQ